MIYCSNCGTGMADDALFCPECGTKTQKIASAGTIPVSTIAENITTQASSAQSIPQAKPANQTGKEVGDFLRVSLPDLMRKILFDPLDGTKKILSEIKEPVKIGLYSILICSITIPLLIYIRIPSEAKRGLDFFEFFFKLFVLPIIGAFVITFFSFIIKAINNSRTANFSNEILTGGIVSIGYAVFFIVAFILSFFFESSLNGSLGASSYGSVAPIVVNNNSPFIFAQTSFGSSFASGPPVFKIVLIFSFFIYLPIITSNSFSQSLRSSGIKDLTAFYISPIVIIISAYLTIRIWIALFAGNNVPRFDNFF
jgi:hypothetical protein